MLCVYLLFYLSSSFDSTNLFLGVATVNPPPPLSLFVLSLHVHEFSSLPPSWSLFKKVSPTLLPTNPAFQNSYYLHYRIQDNHQTKINYVQSHSVFEAKIPKIPQCQIAPRPFCRKQTSVFLWPS